MEKQVKTVTFCTWSSIGSILQSYALNKTLKSVGCDEEIWVEEWSRELRKRKSRSIKKLIKDVIKIFLYGKIKSSYQKRMNFIAQNMKVEYFSDYAAFEKKASENNADIYLAGSDQIWNPDRMNPIFFLDFAENKKRVSYAASMGNTRIAEDKKGLFADMISNFENISVREQECKDTIQQFTEKEISVNIDPTFLVEADSWRKIESEYKVKKPYILLYMIYWNESCRNKIKELKKRTGLPVYAICSDVSKVYADKFLFDVGIEEFLWLIDHAEYIVTSSFHGVALSAIFNKKFAAVINPASPSRIENLLRTLSLPTVKIDELDRAAEFDYDTANMRILEERKKSIDYLKEAIG